jgi:hypothetical protein
MLSGLKARLMQAEFHKRHLRAILNRRFESRFQRLAVIRMNPGAMPQAQNEGAPLALTMRLNHDSRIAVARHDTSQHERRFD